MYTVQELADLYGASRQTIYKKIRSEEMKPYVIENESGIKVDKDGLNVLNAIMADSKVATKQINKQDNQDDIELSSKLTSNNDNLLLSILQNQIEELKKDKQDLQREKEDLKREKQELQMKHDQLINMLINKQQQLEAPKDGFFSRLFKRPS